jgi:hypothetical protein
VNITDFKFLKPNQKNENEIISSMPNLETTMKPNFFPENNKKQTEYDMDKEGIDGYSLTDLFDLEHKPYCTLFYESNLKYPCSQMVYIKGKDILIVTLDDGTVVFFDILALLAKGQDKSRKKVFKIIHDLNYK